MDYKEERNQKGNQTNCTMNQKVSENNDCQGMGGRQTIRNLMKRNKRTDNILGKFADART